MKTIEELRLFNDRLQYNDVKDFDKFEKYMYKQGFRYQASSMGMIVYIDDENNNCGLGYKISNGTYQTGVLIFPTSAKMFFGRPLFKLEI